jgi:beta-N-acetylhexosaminidase
VLPLRKTARVVLLTVSDFDEVATPLPDLARELTRRLDAAPRAFLLDSRSQADEVEPVLDALQNADVLILGLAIRARSGAGHLAVPEMVRRVLEQVPATVKTIGIAHGSPYILRELPQLRTYFCAYGIQPVMQVAAVEAMFGEAPTSGRLPVTIPGLHERGEGRSR